MQAIAATLSEADMSNVAAFYASKQPKPGFAKNKELALARREDLPRRHRRPQRSRPAPAATARTAAASRRSTRASPASTPTTPKRSWSPSAAARAEQPGDDGVAAKLNDREIKALSDYLAGLR